MALAYDAEAMYLVVIGVLSLVLAFVHAPFPLLRGPGWVSGGVVLATLLPMLVAWRFSRQTLRLLDRNPADPSIGQARFNRGISILQITIGVLHAALLSFTGLMRMCYHVPVVGQWPVVGGILTSLPLLLTIVLCWVVMYPADRAVREIALETHLFRGRPVRPVWPLWHYVVFNLRHQVLFVYVPMLLILAARDVITMYRKPIKALFGNPAAPDLLLGVAAVGVALVAPTVLRRVWVTTPLPDGPLRDRLLFLCRKLRMGCREILVWHSGGMIINAAVMGVVAPFRYFLITDAMLEQMNDSRIEAVFGHEAGHVKQHHILFFLLFAFISGCSVTLITYRMRGWDETNYQIMLALIAGGLVLKWGVLFGRVSRRFERQADLYGARTLTLAGWPCEMECPRHEHDENGATRERPGQEKTLCVSAAHAFGETLNEVAHLNGIPTEENTWRHGSIAGRSRSVIKLAGNPQALRAFERRVFVMKFMIGFVALVCALWAVVDLKLWTFVGFAK